MSTTTQRYRVQFYTEKPDGAPVYCVCDFGKEAETGKSPIMYEPPPRPARYALFTDHAEAQRFADDLNEGRAA